MPGFRDFREIAAWQLAHQLKLRVDLFLLSPDFRGHYQFADQLGEAVRSGPRNIAEGFQRPDNAEFARRVRIARGSHQLVMRHLTDAYSQQLITADELLLVQQLTRRAVTAANRLIRALESTQEPFSRSAARRRMPLPTRPVPKGSD